MPTEAENRSVQRRCLFCRSRKSCDPLIQSFSLGGTIGLESAWSRSCIKSLCRLLQISSSHPFKHFLLNANYCPDCHQLLRDIDFTVKQLTNFEKQLRGFRQDLVTKVRGNLAAIPDRESIDAKYEDLDTDRRRQNKKKKFSYDEVVKMLHGKIDRAPARSLELIIVPGDENRYSKSEVRKNPVSIGIKDKCLTNTSDTTNEKRRASSLNQLNYNETTNDDFDDNELPDSCNIVDGNDAADPDWNCSEISGNESGTTETNLKSKPLSFPDFNSDFLTKPKPESFRIEKFVCTEEGCDKIFFKEITLTIHKRQVHEGDLNPYHCDLCETNLKTSSGLMRHKQSCHNENETQALCTICGKIYRSEYYLKKHMRFVHGPDRVHKCKLCHLTFEVEDDQLEHEKLHLDSELPFSCVICNESHTNSIALRSHVEILHSRKKHICEVCGMKFSKLGGLTLHSKRHDESFVKYQCPVCFKNFVNGARLKQHLPRHSTEKTFACSMCNAAFKFSSCLQVHVRKHTGDYPYECKVCQRKFPTGHTLKAHEETHSDVLGYKCKICQKGFKTRKALYQHYEIHPETRTRVRKRRYRPPNTSTTVTGQDNVDKDNEKSSVVNKANPGTGRTKTKSLTKAERKIGTRGNRNKRKKLTDPLTSSEEDEEYPSDSEEEYPPKSNKNRRTGYIKAGQLQPTEPGRSQGEIQLALASIEYTGQEQTQYQNNRSASAATATAGHSTNQFPEGYYDMPNLTFHQMS